MELDPTSNYLIKLKDGVDYITVTTRPKLKRKMSTKENQGEVRYADYVPEGMLHIFVKSVIEHMITNIMVFIQKAT